MEDSTAPQWPPSTIAEIATFLDTGQSVFLHKRDGTLLELPSPGQLHFAEESQWKDQIKALRVAPGDYLEIDAPPSMVQYRWMEEFAGQATPKKVSNILFDAISRKRPFANFREELAAHQLLDQWNTFAQAKYMQETREQLSRGGKVTHPWIVDDIDIWADDDDDDTLDED